MDIGIRLFGRKRFARHGQMLAGAALALALAAPGNAFGQRSGEPPATFNERYPAEQLPAPAPPAAASTTQPANVPAIPPASAGGTQEQTGSSNPETVSRKAHTVAPQEQAPSAKAPSAPTRHQNASPDEGTIETTGRVTRRSARSRIIVERRSFLDAGTEVRPGDRKFLDYAFPPLHQPMDVLTNTGGRTGWHNWPLPGPMFPSGPQN
jgi:hypothetical protein